MIELNLSILENLPEAAVYVVLGRITAINPMAAHYLPQLEIDGPVPGYLDLPRYGPKGVGTFTAGRTTYAFSRTCLLYTSGGRDQAGLIRPFLLQDGGIPWM